LPSSAFEYTNVDATCLLDILDIKVIIMYEFLNKTIIITGASGGMGTALAKELDKRGAKLVLADIDLNGLKLLASALTSDPSHRS